MVIPTTASKIISVKRAAASLRLTLLTGALYTSSACGFAQLLRTRLHSVESPVPLASSLTWLLHFKLFNLLLKETQMSNSVVNYDGSITASPQQLVYPETVEDIQVVLRDPARYPSPVGAMRSCHSLTPCASSDGTMLNMSRMNRIIRIDAANKTFSAQGAGLQFIDASQALRDQDLQFMTNIEIGNMTLGSAACCHTKDALDGIEFGQVNSYVTRIKWVTPGGDLAEASEKDSPDLLRMARGSYGLCGVVYEVTFRVKPVEAVHLSYLPRPVEELTQEEVDDLIDTSEGLICWTVGRTAVFQRRQRVRTRWAFSARSRRAARAPAVEPQPRPRRAPARSVRRRKRCPAQGTAPGHRRPGQVPLRGAAGVRGHHLARPRQDDRLPRDARRAGQVRVHLLGVPALAVAPDLARVPGFHRSALQGHWIPLQHAARLLLHTPRHALRSLLYA